MKLLVALCLVAAVAAAPPRVSYPTDYQVTITKYENENLGLGKYRYAFEQSDGTKVEQTGQLKNEGGENATPVVIGFYTWVGPDDVTYLVRYTADENGFNPEIEQGPGGAVPAHVATLLG